MQGDQEGKLIDRILATKLPLHAGAWHIGASRSAHSLLFGANPAGKMRQREAENRPGSWPNGCGAEGRRGQRGPGLTLELRAALLAPRTHTSTKILP